MSVPEQSANPDWRSKQVKTIKAKYGKDHYRTLGKMGGRASTTKFNSERAQAAIQKRWAKYREEKQKKEGAK